MPESLVRRDQLQREVSRRRTFAIISHPDAGKTTLTEKFLLYGGAIELAGAIRARKQQRHVTSDWMAIERERGISVTTAALQFDVGGSRLNLLDTPGHQDFSEDTYRTLMAVDSAVMVVDGGKGIEAQTRKLFEVCRRRHIPLLTFVNKMDAPARDPLDLLQEIETVLGIDAAPMNWPIGQAPDFQGLYDLRRHQVLRFDRTEHGQRRAPLQFSRLDDPGLRAAIGDEAHRVLSETAELLSVAGTPFEPERFLAGAITPVYFGSALNNFGVEPFLEALLELAPAPGPRASSVGTVRPEDGAFTGFVFKIQANMDPHHRDQVAFVRVCSGRFQRGMAVQHPRTGKTVRLNRPHRLFGGAREVMDEAYAGDVVGLSSKGTFEVGDCLSEGEPVQFDPFPRFAPEHFAYLHNDDIGKYKQFHQGLQQMEAEGVIQIFVDPAARRREPIIAAVGELQFDVVVARLGMEYNVEARIERLPYTHCRWVEGTPDALATASWPRQEYLGVEDRDGRPVALFASDWQMRYCMEKNPKLSFVTWA
jgi:peptide chain release factor 3